MTGTPTVSVIMSVYNGEKYLREAVDSILRQSIREFEFIILNDGSTDSTWAILQSYKDPSLVLLNNEENIGLARSLNKGLAKARGKYIARIDADDISLPERLERQVGYLDVHPEVGLLGTASRVLDEETGNESTVSPPLQDNILRSVLGRRNPFHHSSVMMPRRVLEEEGGYKESYRVGIDYELWVRIACSNELANLPDVLATRRVHRPAYFNWISPWEKYRTFVRIRWYAWRWFSLPLADIRFIVYPNRIPRDFVALKFPRFAALYRGVVSRLGNGRLGA